MDVIYSDVDDRPLSWSERRRFRKIRPGVFRDKDPVIMMHVKWCTNRTVLPTTIVVTVRKTIQKDNLDREEEEMK